MAADKPILIEDELTMWVMVEQHPTWRLRLQTAGGFWTWYCSSHGWFAGRRRFNTQPLQLFKLYLDPDVPDVTCTCCFNRLRDNRTLR